MAQRLKINDTVKVISGEYKGKVAKIIRLNREKGYAWLEGIGERERHLRKSYLNPLGGKRNAQLGIHLSNLKLEQAYQYEKPKASKADKAKKDSKKDSKKDTKVETTDKKGKKGAK